MPVLDEDLIANTEPRGQDHFLWDSAIRGFGVKIAPTGRKSFVLQLRLNGPNSQSRRRTIGRFGEISLAEARLMATEARDTLLRQRESGASGDADAAGDAPAGAEGEIVFGGLGAFFGSRTTSRSRIMTAATKIFVEHGFDTSLEAIAQAAGVTRPTIYRYFGSKEELLQAVLTVITTEIPGVEIDRDAPPHKALLDFAHAVRAVVLHENYMALTRLAMVTSEYRAELSQHGLGNQRRTLLVLTKYLRWAMRNGLFRKANVDRAGERFLSSVFGFSRTRQLFWGYPQETPKQAELYVREAVTAFVRDMMADRDAAGAPDCGK